MGVAYEMHQQSRCFPSAGGTDGTPPRLNAITNDCPDDELLIGLDHWTEGETLPTANLNGWLYPFDVFFRLSFGVTIDL